MSRTLRTFSTLGRSSFRSYPLHLHNGSAHVQPVRIVRPILTKRRAQTVAMYAVGLAVYLHFVVGPNVEEEEVAKPRPAKNKSKENTTAHNKEGEERAEEGTEEEGLDTAIVPDTIPEDAIFIPLGWARKLPPTLYKGSDPEWQSFVEFSHDRKRSLRIRNELAGLVGHHLTHMVGFQRFLGTPMQTGKYWLDVDYPDGPPPEYERSGLEITDDYIAWTTRPVSALNHSRLQRALWPTSMGSSIWASSAALWSLQVAKFKHFFNLKSNPEADDPHPPNGYIDFRRFAKTTDKQPPEAGPGVDPSRDSKTQDSVPAKSTARQASSDAGRILPPLPSLPQPGEGLNSAVAAFKRTLAKTWKPAGIPPPRGTFLVSGLVEVRGPHGLCILDVRAAYHPKLSRWEAIAIGVRRVQPRKQAPKGGA